MAQNNKSARDLALALTKKELVALMDEKWCWRHINSTDIILTQLNTLREKSEKTFSQYIAFKLPKINDSAAGILGFYKALAEKEKIYKKYERMQKRIENGFKQIETLRNQ